MENNHKEVFQKLKEDFFAYTTLKIELFKLNSYEILSRLSSIIFYGSLIVLFIFFLSVFLFVSLGFYLGSLFDSNSIGFLCVALIFFFILIVIFFYKKRLINWCQNKVIKALSQCEHKILVKKEEDEFINGIGRKEENFAGTMQDKGNGDNK